jgi:hypothetical protein
MFFANKGPGSSGSAPVSDIGKIYYEQIVYAKLTYKAMHVAYNASVDRYSIETPLGVNQ